MNHPANLPVPPADGRTTALVYEKTLALRGMICGVLMLLGSPFFVLAFHETVDSVGRPDLWAKMFPDWLAATMLCIGMIGGVLTIVLSVLFGLLIPSRVTRENATAADESKLSSSP